MSPTLNHKEMVEAHPMSGGDGLNSYSQNSSYQRGVIIAASAVISEVISDNLDIIKNPSFINPSTPFRIADVGCSTGPNTFFAVQAVMESVELKYKSSALSPEFQVFFNDHVNNDFNVLFRSLPPARKYFSAGVPGSFHGRLFPSGSLHFVLCSYALHWLSRVPPEIQDKSSPAYSRGTIHYTGNEKEMVRAYLGQFQRDMDSFLKFRAEEMVGGGLLAIQIPVLPAGEDLLTRTGGGMFHVLLGDSLMELAKSGAINEELVDSFNVPQYHPRREELERIIEKNNYFSIEKAIILNNPSSNLPFDVKTTSAQVKAVLQGLMEQHFGQAVTDQLFDDMFPRKLASNHHFFEKEIRKDTDFCIVLKRKTTPD